MSKDPDRCLFSASGPTGSRLGFVALSITAVVAMSACVKMRPGKLISPAGPMISVPGGTYEIGCRSECARWYSRHRRVTVPSFAMERNEAKLANGDALELQSDQAVRLCKSRGLRLPMEEEWEIAASFPDGRRFPWGDEEKDLPLSWSKPEQSPSLNSALGFVDLGSGRCDWVETYEGFFVCKGSDSMFRRSAFSKYFNRQMGETIGSVRCAGTLDVDAPGEFLLVEGVLFPPRPTFIQDEVN